MTIKEKIEKNPFISLIIVSLVIVSGVIAVLQYFHSKEISILEKQNLLKIDELNSKLSSIKRGIGDSDYFDIRQLFITKDDMKSVSQNLLYYESDQFYAQSNLENFIYKKYSEPELFKYENDIEPPELFYKLYGSMYIHQWVSNQEMIVEGVNDLKKISARIRVHKRSKEDLKGMLGELYHKVNVQNILKNYIEKNKLSDGEFDTLNINKNLENIYDGNWSAIFLDKYLTNSLTLPTMNSNVEYELLNVNKVGNIIYVQGLTTLKDVNINGVKYNTYYLRDEVIIASNFKDVYIIRTLVPSSDPSTRNNYFNFITEWLSNFKIIINN